MHMHTTIAHTYINVLYQLAIKLFLFIHHQSPMILTQQQLLTAAVPTATVPLAMLMELMHIALSIATISNYL